MNLTETLKAEYRRLWSTAEISLHRLGEVTFVAERALRHRREYIAAVRTTRIPWHVVAAIHSLESGANFTKHLHNGDPLVARTVRVPVGRPPHGNPPFAWEVSAADALRYTRMSNVTDWSVEQALYRLEAWNGWGYREHHPDVLSPYLWAGTQHYTRGKYVADGKWSHDSVSTQVGAVALLKRLEQMGEIYLSDKGPIPIVYSLAAQDGVSGLQRFLNLHARCDLLVDGVAGPRTSKAFREVFGRYLMGDPRDAA